MKRKISVLVLALCCLLLLSGCCLSHQWQDAACDAPKTCARCGETEGEALGHSWVDATTEAPKTCTVCAATEGERIITDPRFTTAATKDVQGTWVCETALTAEQLGLTGSDASISLTITMVLMSDGTMTTSIQTGDPDHFLNRLSQELLDYFQSLLAGTSLSQEEIDNTFRKIYGMTATEYVTILLEELGLNLATLDGLSATEVYYVAEGLFFSADNWDGEFSSLPYECSSDRLILGGDLTGLTTEPMTFSRIPE